tara:strand:- start:70 stop:402 length:333 start_codon:yes stop_codon:yes gene_type:complete
MKLPESNNYRARKGFFEDSGLEQKELIGIICDEMEKTEELSEVKKDLLSQVKELSKMNGELRREKHDLEDRLIALQIEWQDLYHKANKSWFVKLNDKLSKLSIRNPFYIK